MGPLQTLLDRQGFVVVDGGLATELERHGEQLNDPLWSARVLLQAPEKIEAVHYNYLLAGADIATTASYQASIPGLRARGLNGHEAETAVRRSVELAESARERFWNDPRLREGRQRPLVAASVGPYGAYLHDGSEYRGDYGLSVQELKEFHRDRLTPLASSGADLLACESIPSRLEAQALIELLSELAGVEAWLSFTCRDEAHISDGTPFAEMAAWVASSPRVVAVGVNCTAPRFIDGLLKSAQQHMTKPFVVYPNSGETFVIATSSWCSTSEADQIVPAVCRWYENGARLIGGCCRTTPDTIGQIRRELRKTSPQMPMPPDPR